MVQKMRYADETPMAAMYDELIAETVLIERALKLTVLLAPVLLLVVVL